MSIRFSLIAFLTLILFASCNATAPAADADIVTAKTSTLWGAQFGAQEPELQNLPLVHAGQTPDADGLTEVTVRNIGETTLLYYGYGPDGPQHFMEVRGADGWETNGWDWCGTGMERFSIAPGGTAVFRVHFNPRSAGDESRVLTGFQEKDTDRRSYVVLATR